MQTVYIFVFVNIKMLVFSEIKMLVFCFVWINNKTMEFSLSEGSTKEGVARQRASLRKRRRLSGVTFVAQQFSLYTVRLSCNLYDLGVVDQSVNNCIG